MHRPLHGPSGWGHEVRLRKSIVSRRPPTETPKVASTAESEGGITSRWSAATTYPDMWADPDDDPRENLDEGTGEKAVLAAYLDRYRMTLEMKCEGLDTEQLARRSVHPSTMSLLGLLRHLASVEHAWFRRFIEGHQELPRLYRSEEDHDVDFNGAVADDATVADHLRDLVDAPELGRGGLPERVQAVHQLALYGLSAAQITTRTAAPS